MKYPILFCVFFLLAPLAMAGNGSFLILKSTYLYPHSDQQGKKTLTRNRKAYEVINIDQVKGSSLMFEIAFDDNKEGAVNSSGFIVETESELKEMGINEVKVYPEMPNMQSDLTDYQLVPSNQLSFTGRQVSSPDFPQLTWIAVNFKTSGPMKVWVPEWAGIYRPDKDAAWLNKAYDALKTRKLDQNLMDKIMMGQVESGFTKEQVKMALGNPLEEQRVENEGKLEWIYNGRKIIFMDGVVSQVL